MKVLNFKNKRKVDVMECWNSYADKCDEIERYYRRKRYVQIVLALLFTAIACLGAYLLGVSHSQAETQAARSEAQRAQAQSSEANKLTATALQEMDRMENKISLVSDICPWFNETAGKVQKAELEIDRNEKMIRRNS